MPKLHHTTVKLDHSNQNSRAAIAKNHRVTFFTIERCRLDALTHASRSGDSLRANACVEVHVRHRRDDADPAKRQRRWLPRPTCDILNTCRQGSDFQKETGAHFYAQAHISTQPPSPLEDARLSLTYEDQVGRSRAEPSSCRRPQARLSQRWFSRLSGSPVDVKEDAPSGFSSKKSHHLRTRDAK